MMVREATSLLLDTNVWMGYLSALRPDHKAAFHLVDECCKKDVELLYAVTSSKDVFYAAALDFKRDYRAKHEGALTESASLAARTFAWACVDLMRELGTAVGCDMSDVWFACKQRSIHGDYEDDLFLAAAQRSKTTLLVTSDEKLLRHCPVAALDVKDALAYVEQIEA